MALFDDVFDAAQNGIDAMFGIDVIINGQKVIGIFSTPSVNIHSDRSNLSTILQKKIFEFHEVKNGIKAKEGQKVEIKNEIYTIEEIYRDSYGIARVTLQEDYQ